jgi:hypothetical protein
MNPDDASRALQSICEMLDERGDHDIAAHVGFGLALLYARYDLTSTECAVSGMPAEL